MNKREAFWICAAVLYGMWMGYNDLGYTWWDFILSNLYLHHVCSPFGQKLCWNSRDSSSGPFIIWKKMAQIASRIAFKLPILDLIAILWSLNSINNNISQPTFTTSSFSITELTSARVIFMCPQCWTHSLLNVSNTIFFLNRVFLTILLVQCSFDLSKRICVAISNVYCISKLVFIYGATKHLDCSSFLHIIRGARIIFFAFVVLLPLLVLLSTYIIINMVFTLYTNSWLYWVI